MSLTNLMYKEIHFDSDEEVFVAMWLEELRQRGYIRFWKKVKDSISLTDGKKIPYLKVTKLKTKSKVEQKDFILLSSSEYTPDFEITWDVKGLNKFLYQITENIYHQRHVKERGGITDPRTAVFFSSEYNTTVLEVKPGFDQNNMERLFKNNQRFIWDKYKLFVNLIEPIDLFKKTFLPLAAAPYFRYKKVPKKALAKGKKIGDFKFDWQPLTIEEFLDKNKD